MLCSEYDWSFSLRTLPGEEDRWDINDPHEMVTFSGLTRRGGANYTEAKRTEVPNDVNWHMIFPSGDGSGDFYHHITEEMRAEMWAEMNDASESHPLVTLPQRLVDAWAESPRFREDLNALETNLDSKYYNEAYCIS